MQKFEIGKNKTGLLIATMCILTLGLWTPFANAQQIPGVIIDQDMSSDHDDVADLSAICALANAGKCQILACMADAQNGGTPLCQNAICTYYGYPNVPCGVLPNIGGVGTYCGQIAAEFPHPLYQSASQCPLAVNLYRQILASQPDHSVVIVTTGFLDCLEALLKSGSDGYSSLTGSQLVAQKVALWSCAGGQYPSGGEFNFGVSPAAAYYVVNNWPAPVTCIGFELGGPIGTAADIASTPRTSPVRRVWEIFTYAFNWGIYSAWGQVADIVATRGAEDGLYNLYNTGRNNCNPDGTNFWSAVTPPATEAYLLETERYPMVQSINAALNAIPSTQPAPPPAQPSNLGAKAVSGSQVNLTWDNNAYNATGCQIERRNNTTGAYATIATLGNVTSYSDTTLTSTANLAYRVKATNANGSSRYSYAYLYSGWTETNFSNPTGLPLYNYYHSSNLDSTNMVNAGNNHITINNDSTHGQNVTINVEVGTAGNGGSWYIYFFYQDTNDWYRLNVTSSSSQFQKDVGGTISNIGAAGPGDSILGVQFWQINVTPGRLQFNASAVANQASISISLNVTDTFSFTTGKIGLGGVGNNPVWQNFFFDTTANVANGLTATAGLNQVSLNWNPVSGATGYNIYRSTGEGDVQLESTPIATVTGTSYTDTAGPNATDSMGGDEITYYYQVSAVSGSNVYGLSNEAGAAPTGPPPPPMGIALYGAGNTGITILWDPQIVTAMNPAGNTYNVYRGTTPGGESPTPVATGLTSTSYADGNLSPGTTYYYKVAAVNSSGTSTFWGELAATTTGGSTPPAVPTGLAATGGNAQMVLSWTAGGGATSYNVYRGTSAGGESSTAIATGITATSYTDTGLNNGTTYYYTVAAVNSSGTSSASNESSATPAVSGTGGSNPPSAPTGLTATGGNAQVGLSWTAGSGATSYNVYRGTSAGGESSTAIATGIATTFYTDTGLSNGTTYYYTVAAANSSGASSSSNESSATPAVSGTGTGSASIGVQFVGSGTALATTQSAGLSSVAQTYWNALAGSSFTNQALNDSTGAGTTAQLNGSANGIYRGGGSLALPAGNADLASGELFNTWPSAPTLTVFNIPYAQYDIYVYAGIDAAGRNETVSVTPSGGAAQYFSFLTMGGGSVWTAATSTWNGTGTAPTLPGANYAHFSGLTAGSFTMAWGAPGNGGLNGIQIVSTGVITPATPTGLTAASGTGVGQIALSWTASTGAQSYILQRSTSSGGGYTPIATVTAPATSYTDSDASLLAGQNYYYEIAAVNTNGTSVFSASAAATPYVPATFNGWAYSYFGLNAPAGQAGDTADPAKDGLSNLLKYALGLNPLIPETFQPTVTHSSATWQFTFQRPANRADITYAVEVSPDLSTWTSTGVTLTETGAGDPETWQATYTPAAGSKLFFRLQITGP